MTEPDNLVLVQLRELRAEIKASEERTTKRLEAIESRLDALHLNGVKALRNFIGHRSIMERAMASIDADLKDLKIRVERLEAEPA